MRTSTTTTSSSRTASLLLLLMSLPVFALACGGGAGAGKTTIRTSAAASSSTMTKSATSGSVTITLKHNTPAEEATRTQLERLLATYDLTPWIMTRTIEIDETSIPHSHPVMTFHARHLKNDDQLLSTFIHENMHWLMDVDHTRTERAAAALRLRFPSLPVGFPDGADSDESNYTHLPIIYLEYEGLKSFVGEARANETFRFWSNDHYRVLYRLFLENQEEIAAIAQREGLIPASLKMKPVAMKPVRFFDEGVAAATDDIPRGAPGSAAETAQLERIVRDAEASHSDSLIVIKNKKLMIERYFGTKHEPLETMSCTKSFASLAIGFLLADKKIASLDTPLSHWYPEFGKEKDSKKAKITLRHILTHTSGIDHKSRAGILMKQDDRLAYVRDLPVIDEPGTKFSYNNEATQLLSGIIAIASGGKTIDQYLNEKLFTPLNIHDWSWAKDKKGNLATSYGLALHARDFARVGETLLANGRYHDHDVIPSSWIAQSTKPSRNDMNWTGFLWWTERDGPWFSQNKQSLAAYVSPMFDASSKLDPLNDRRFENRSAYWVEAGALLSPAERTLFLSTLRDDRVPFATDDAKVIGYRADGWLGQYLVVLPELGVIGVRQHREPAKEVDQEKENDANGFKDFSRLLRGLGQAS